MRWNFKSSCSCFASHSSVFVSTTFSCHHTLQSYHLVQLAFPSWVHCFNSMKNPTTHLQNSRNPTTLSSLSASALSPPWSLPSLKQPNQSSKTMLTTSWIILFLMLSWQCLILNAHLLGSLVTMCGATAAEFALLTCSLLRDSTHSNTCGRKKWTNSSNTSQNTVFWEHRYTLPISPQPPS